MRLTARPSSMPTRIANSGLVGDEDSCTEVVVTTGTGGAATSAARPDIFSATMGDGCSSRNGVVTAVPSAGSAAARSTARDVTTGITSGCLDSGSVTNDCDRLVSVSVRFNADTGVEIAVGVGAGDRKSVV